MLIFPTHAEAGFSGILKRVFTLAGMSSGFRHASGTGRSSQVMYPRALKGRRKNQYPIIPRILISFPLGPCRNINPTLMPNS